MDTVFQRDAMIYDQTSSHVHNASVLTIVTPRSMKYSFDLACHTKYHSMTQEQVLSECKQNT